MSAATAPEVPLRAVLYLRLSVSREESTSLDRQERDLRAVAEREGWEIVATHSDDGLSGGKRREQAEAALAMLADGTADVLAVWKFDRWSRQGATAVADLQDVLDARRDAGRPALFVADRDGLRSDSPSWDVHVALIAALGRTERETIRARARSSRAGLAHDLRFGGGSVPYGYRTVPHPSGTGRALDVEPEEAEHIRYAVRRLLDDGASLYAVAGEMTERGAVTRRGARRWSTQVLRQIITSDVALGYLVRAGRPVVGEDGAPMQAWPAIITPEDAAALRARYRKRTATASLPAGSPERVEAARKSREAARRPRASRLLSGLLTCCRCGATLTVGQGRQPDGKVFPRYVCPLKASRRCEGGMSVTAEPLERVFSADLLAVAGHMPVIVEREVSGVDSAEVARLEMRRHDIAREMAETDDDDRADVLAAEMRAVRVRLREIAAEPTGPRVERVETGETIAEAWEAGTLERRRSLLRSALTGPVEILPGVRGRHGESAVRARVEIPWRWTEPDVEQEIADAAAAWS